MLMCIYNIYGQNLPTMNKQNPLSSASHANLLCKPPKRFK